MPINAEPALDRIILTSAKSVLISPGVVMRLVMPDTPCSSTSSAILNAFEHAGLFVGHRQQSIVGDDDQRVDFFLQPLHAGVGLHRSAPTLEAERTRDNTDRQCADAARHTRR